MMMMMMMKERNGNLKLCFLLCDKRKILPQQIQTIVSLLKEDSLGLLDNLDL